MDLQRSPPPPPSSRQPPSSYYRNKAIRTMMMTLLIIVSAGYLLIWIMSPTNLYYKTWSMKIQSRANSTYFGRQGANFLIYTFPVLFIAAMGCVYLHLGKKQRDHEYHIKRPSGSNRTALMKKPVIIKGLGIVSWTEITLFLMFIGLLIWSFAKYLSRGFAEITPSVARMSGEKMWTMKLEFAALFLGLVGNICLAFLFFPVTRGSSVLQFFGLTSEASVKYHIWLGHITMTLFTAHGICYIVYWDVTHNLSQMLKWDKTGVSHVAGEISLLAGLFLWATTIPQIRRKIFELFFYTHHLYIIFVFFFVLHVGIGYACMMLPGFYLFMVDRFLRFLQSRQHVRLISARVFPCEAVELNFSKSRGLTYTPTSIMFVNVGGISKLQWHPFTVTSNSNLEPEKLSVIIKGEGSWSNKLYQLLSSPSSIARLDVSVEGPYGPPSTEFFRHDLLVMVSGGSGITPFVSIIREMIYANETIKCKTPQILLISSFKNSLDLTMLDLLPTISNVPSDFSKLGLQIEAYVTREKQNSTEEKKSIRTIWFKPNQSDGPITPILGENNFLWLGVIISTSFVLYLILIGILTRYYIYPIDHNTNKIYSSSSKAVLNIIFICVCIVITSTLAFLWNKRKNVKETTQIQNVEGATPMASPNSWLYNADRELESLPQESLNQSINVHYGERPDLKRILFERKESSVGVLVCGPKKMRHEVARICSAGLAPNLHFESISFSW